MMFLLKLLCSFSVCTILMVCIEAFGYVNFEESWGLCFFSAFVSMVILEIKSRKKEGE